jgi:hypothetical protein
MFIQHYGIHRAYVNLPVVNFDETIEKIASVGFESEEWNQVLQSLSLPSITTFIRFDLTKWTIEEAKSFLEKAIDDQCCDKGWQKPLDICVIDYLTSFISMREDQTKSLQLGRKLLLTYYAVMPSCGVQTSSS